MNADAMPVQNTARPDRLPIELQTLRIARTVARIGIVVSIALIGVSVMANTPISLPFGSILALALASALCSRGLIQPSTAMRPAAVKPVVGLANGLSVAGGAEAVEGARG